MRNPNLTKYVGRLTLPYEAVNQIKPPHPAQVWWLYAFPQEPAAQVKHIFCQFLGQNVKSHQQNAVEGPRGAETWVSDVAL